MWRKNLKMTKINMCDKCSNKSKEEDGVVFDELCVKCNALALKYYESL